jgi:hypothetical protein
MKTALRAVLLGLTGLVTGACVLLGDAPALAAEGRGDRETDHIDAFDDGGPRTFGLLLNPAVLALGSFAAEGDFVLGDAAVLSIAGDWRLAGSAAAYGVTAGVPLYPWRIVFHGFYVDPRVMWAHATSESVSANVVGIGGTLGWQATWRFGLTLRCGAGAAYEVPLAEVGAASFSVAEVRPLLDGEVGWVF